MMNTGLRQSAISSALLALVAVAAAAQTGAEVELQLHSPPDLPVGATVVLGAAEASGGGAVTLFRFGVAPAGGEFRILRDFSPRRGLEWTPLEEGIYDIRVTALDESSRWVSEDVVRYRVRSRITKGEAAVSSLDHPLVALYSVPPCWTGQVRVRFRPASGTFWRTTPWKRCRSGRSVNFHVAGMLSNTSYLMQHEHVTAFGAWSRGDPLPFRTRAVDLTLFEFAVPRPCRGCSRADGVLLHSVTFGDDFAFPFPVATDLSGRVLWYYSRLGTTQHFGSYLVQPLPGGNMLLLLNDGLVGQVLREIDVAGNTVRETSAARIRAQLAEVDLVRPDRYFVGALHHEGVRLPNGHTLLVTSAEHLVNGVDHLADVVVDLDEDLQVVWAFNSFEELPLLERPTPRGEVCTSPRVDGCQELFLGESALDLTHTNTIEYLPEDGNLLLSMRNQDWIVKIDYRDGTGTGAVLWRLGREGDFSIDSEDDWPWFSHQHSVQAFGDRILLYDNGNTRHDADPSAESRGQVLRIDEASRTARLELNVDLGLYAQAFGSAERLANGKYNFVSGFLEGAWSRSVEVTPRGTTSYSVALVLDVEAAVYRSWRMRDMYTP